MGNAGRICAGDVQWMTAGSGIIHQEMPEGDPTGHMGGFQLWANLPASDKMIPPRYCGVEAAAIPEVVTAEARVRVICGTVAETVGPVRDIRIEPEYLDVTVNPGATWTHPAALGHTVFAYLFEGAACFGPEGLETCAGNGAVILLGDGDRVAATAGPDGARFLLVSGRPLREPIAWGGPIVMNTDDELRQAFEEYHDGTFVKESREQG
jgi:redox-sensitive bicupin YhaK (pirin superfamily)